MRESRPAYENWAALHVRFFFCYPKETMHFVSFGVPVPEPPPLLPYHQHHSFIRSIWSQLPCVLYVHMYIWMTWSMHDIVVLIPDQSWREDKAWMIVLMVKAHSLVTTVGQYLFCGANCKPKQCAGLSIITCTVYMTIGRSIVGRCTLLQPQSVWVWIMWPIK